MFLATVLLQTLPNTVSSPEKMRETITAGAVEWGKVFKAAGIEAQ